MKRQTTFLGVFHAPPFNLFTLNFPVLPKICRLFWALLLLGLCLAITGCATLRTAKTAYNTPFILHLGQTNQLADSPYTLTFLGVIQDARCPLQVECETHGPVLVKLAFQHLDKTPIILEMNPEPALAAPTQGQTVLEVSTIEITLLSVDPYPDLPEDLLNFDDYEVTLSVSKIDEAP